MVGTLGNGIGVGRASRFRYIATAGQTTFSGADASPQALTLTYTPGFVEVAVDGVWLTPDEYTATNGSAIVFPVGLAVGRVVYIYALSSFATGDSISFLTQQALSAAQKGVAAANIGMQCTPQGRLTLASGQPVMNSSQAAKTTVFYSPYIGDQIPIWNGTNYIPTTFTELSVATTDTTKNPAAIGASKVNDWFVWNDAGTIRLSHGPDWTNDSTRSAGTALLGWRGLYLNNASITNGPAATVGTYVGTTRSNGSSQIDYIFGGPASGGSAGFFGVWNCYNRVSTASMVIDNGSFYTYSSATIRQARASAGNQTTVVLGLSEDAITASISSRFQTVNVTSAFLFAGIGIDSTSAFQPGRLCLVSGTTVVEDSTLGQQISTLLTAGVHVISSNEQSDGSHACSFDVNNDNVLCVTVRN